MSSSLDGTAMRSYTVFEIDQMRCALKWINPAPAFWEPMYGRSEDFDRARQQSANAVHQWTQRIEDQLRTYMSAGTTPLELDALAEDAIVSGEKDGERKMAERKEYEAARIERYKLRNERREPESRTGVGPSKTGFWTALLALLSRRNGC